MNEDIAAYVGVDWASATHYAYALDAQGAKLGHRSFQHSGDGLAELADWIQRTTGCRARPDRDWHRGPARARRREPDGFGFPGSCAKSKAA
ncbi:transposase [Bradyrhizobium sp. LA6.1]|uniref:IS110 family transposase n=1 Tax=Bradyrhizobium sp. LA6.1 TaxID=3156378 RepID=UPI00339546D6